MLFQKNHNDIPFGFFFFDNKFYFLISERPTYFKYLLL